MNGGGDRFELPDATPEDGQTCPDCGDVYTSDWYCRCAYDDDQRKLRREEPEWFEVSRDDEVDE